MERTALYIRVSTQEQALHGLSIEAQRANLENWAKRNRKEVVGVYADEGISARKKASKRPALQRLLRDVEAGKVDLIAFTKLDRWFRNIAEYYKVQEILEAHRVNWRTILEDYDTSTASGRLKINIMLSVAQDEADRTSERIKVVFDSKRAKNELPAGSLPKGYRREGRAIVLDEKTAPIVRAAFDLYFETGRFYYICPRSAQLGKCTNTKNYSEEMIERYLLDHIDSKLEIMLELQQKPPASHKPQRDALKKKLARLSELWVDELITKEDYKRQYEALTAALAAIPEDERAIDMGAIRSRFSGDWKSVYAELSADGKRAFWRQCLEQFSK